MKRVIFGLAVLLVTASPSHADWTMNLTRGVTDISREIYDLHMVIFWICVVIGVLVFGVMLWSVVYHRKSRGAKAKNFHESLLVEITWTIVPFIILIGMAVPATATLIKMYDNTEADIDIQVTGYQWKWRYQYLAENVDFFSSLSTPREQINNTQEKTTDYLLEVDNPLVIPVGKKVRFLLTANDVIHSWWVPEFAVKKDAIPGFINEAWVIVDKPGVYRGQCAELCGKEHGFMPIVVEVKTVAEYESWLAEVKQADAKQQQAAMKSWNLADLMAMGEEVYNKACLACHQAEGEGIPGAFPALKNSPVALGEVSVHIDVVLNGKPGTAMQAYKEQLSAVELAAVITYERNAWGNKTGDIVTPAQIAELKE